MPTIVNIKIRNNTYQIACDESQVSHVKTLSQKIDQRIKDLASQSPKANDVMLIIMAALMMENEISELKMNQDSNVNADRIRADTMTDTIDAVSEHIEEYIKTLEEKLKKVYNES